MNLKKMLKFNTGNKIGVKVVTSNNDVYTNKTYILEAVYNFIANEFAKLDFYVYKETLNKDKVKEYDFLEGNSLNECLQIRANETLTPYDFKQIMAYQLLKYGNALAEIVRNEKGQIIKFIPYNLEEYSFGNGYQLLNGRLVLHLKHTYNPDNPFTKNAKNITDDIYLDYNDLIHLRLQPNSLFDGDLNNFLGIDNPAVQVVDKQLNAIINDLADNRRLKGYVTQGKASLAALDNSLNSNSSKVNKSKEISNRFREADDVVVFDSGENFQEFKTNFTHINEQQFQEVKKLLFDLKGINEGVLNGDADSQKMEVFFSKTIKPIAIKFKEEIAYKCLTKTSRTQGYKIDFERNVFEYAGVSEVSGAIYKYADKTSKNETRRDALYKRPINNGDVIYDNLNFKPTDEHVKEVAQEEILKKGGDKLE